MIPSLYARHPTIDPRRVKITTAPTIEPVTLAEAKLHCRVDDSSEDAKFTDWIQQARMQCEEIAQRSFITRTYTAYLDYWPYWTRFELPYPPLISLTSVKYYDRDGNAAVTFDPANYFVDTHSEPGRFALKWNSAWPGASLRELNGVEIIYTAGYGALATAVPTRYKEAMLLLIGHLYEHRESVIIDQGISVQVLPQGLYDMLYMDAGGFN